MGAVVCSDKVQPPFGKHGSTFGGNPLACAAGIAAIDFMLDEKLADQARDKGAYFKAMLAQSESSKVREIRQLGLMIGIELKEKAQPFLVALMERGVLAMPTGATVIRFLPPLVITTDELDFVAAQVTEVLR